ncbi:hypothetical protein H4O20_14620 [Aequorivita sp. 609]|uniref:hypothetical protein n=1 Tax=Aequorivita TaxID=153265 RepID=UPI0013EB8C79|nr:MULTISPECIES: hypothetical protein [Aequorivita]MBB6682679.1 hypothetical protein [Aequorivita sp. 609]NGX85136.1 hypothetical protein [Aequorivita sp. KMM 9714]HLV92766.1 hypothetical protein [Aequorivita sp.]
MKKIFFLLLLLPLHLFAQEAPSSEQFWNNLKSHCGKAYEGVITAGGKEGDGFMGEKLVMHVRSCEENIIRVPFFVGENRSRTWVLTLQDDNRILLKHDHRHEDGTEEDVTQYGGLSSNTGLPNIQFFPADQHTSNMLPLASTNVWWFTLDDTSMTYNLRRIGSDRVFTVKFDLTKEVETPAAPWGYEK